MTVQEFDPQVNPDPLPFWGNRLAWLTIVLVTAGLLLLSLSSNPQRGNQGQPSQISSVDLSQLEMQGKTLIYQHGFSKKTPETPASAELADPPRAAERKVVVPVQLDEGTINQRWCYSVLLNELESSRTAIEYLADIKARLEAAELRLSPDQERVHQLLVRVFENCEAGNFSVQELSPSEVDLLQSQLGWFRQLLFAADTAQTDLRQGLVEQAKSSMHFGIAIFFVGAFAVLLGLACWLLAIGLFAVRGLRPTFAHQPSRHNLYLQTFAIWMVVFFGGQITVELLLSGLGDTQGTSQLAWGLLPFLGSLVALSWPWFRGVSFQNLASDIGWKMKNPLIEVGIGLTGYLMLLPFMLVALVIFLGLTLIVNPSDPNDFSAGNKPSHPIQEFVAQGDVTTICLVLVMACVAAPLVEETMFRGVFYRYLRDASRGMAMGLSIAIACLVNSFIFAAIHPQGLLALPLLGTLAIGFSIARERRDSLIAPMVMHGVNNGLVSTLLIFFL